MSRSITQRLGTQTISVPSANEVYLCGLDAGGSALANVPTTKVDQARVFEITNWGTGLLYIEAIPNTKDPVNAVSTSVAQYVIPPVSSGVPFSMVIDVSQNDVLVAKASVTGNVRVTEKVVIG